jgi:hypothetical protein
MWPFAGPWKPVIRCFEGESFGGSGLGHRVAERGCALSFYRFFETFSYLPPLRGDEIGKQVDYITGNGWVPCLEFADPDKAYVDSGSSSKSDLISPEVALQ